MPTDEELEKSRKEVESLRKEVADNEAERAAKVADKTREVEAKRLEREKQRLQTRLGQGGPQEVSRPATPTRPQQQHPSVPPTPGDDDNKE